MNWVLGIVFILVSIFLMAQYHRKKRRKNFRDSLVKNWGKPKKDDFFNFYNISRYYENNFHKKEAYHIIADATKEDLDLDELFKFLDRTTSKIGQQYLYFKLRTIGGIEELKEFGKLSDLFLENDSLRLESQWNLSVLKTEEAYDLELLINDEPLKKPSYFKFIYASSIASVICLGLAFVNPMFSLFLLPLFCVNTVFHYKNKDNINYYINGVSQLTKALKVSKKLLSFEELKTHFDEVSFIKHVQSIQLKTEFIRFEKGLTNEYAALFWLPIELIKIQFNLELLVFYSFIEDITKEKQHIDALFQFIGKVDAAISTASVRAGALPTCTPVFVSEKQLSVSEITHPLVGNCIDNDLILVNDSLLLTGSNMSGKSTFIRTMALNSILAQTCYFCFAKSYQAPYFKLYSSIRISDDLSEQTSYYLQEVLNIKKLIKASHSKQPCLFVLDEIFKGTNTVERVSAGKAILSYLNKGNHMVMVSTHDIELTDLLSEDNYKLHHFSESILNESLFFDHKLKEGKLKTRNAIKVLELYDYPMEIITKARGVESDCFG
ncbi:MAG: DNA mismatch repair protein MutS [Flavobacteriaceae bacterium]|nr:MAG: DNA mismatch repair protein MutS [Flavobacteriaceae bacterium]